MKYTTLLLALIMTTACATSDGSGPLGPGTHQITRFSVLYEGPEIAATVAHSSGERSLGEEWLVLAAEITAAREGGPIILKRDQISLRTPDGRRLALITQDEFRSSYPTFMIPVERTLANRPMLDRYYPSRDVPCERWFFAAPPEVITYDELVKAGSEKAAHDANLYRLKGKDYVVQDGDVLHIRFNV